MACQGCGGTGLKDKQIGKARGEKPQLVDQRGLIQLAERLRFGAE